MGGFIGQQNTMLPRAPSGVWDRADNLSRTSLPGSTGPVPQTEAMSDQQGSSQAPTEGTTAKSTLAAFEIKPKAAKEWYGVLTRRFDFRPEHFDDSSSSGDQTRRKARWKKAIQDWTDDPTPHWKCCW